jgi:hypothetical protein
LAFSTIRFHLRRSWTCPVHFISFIFFRGTKMLPFFFGECMKKVEYLGDLGTVGRTTARYVQT